MTEPDVGDSLDAMIRAINRAYRLRLNDSMLADLTLPELQALRFLERRPGAGLHHLAAETGRDKAQVTRAVRALEKRGLLLRQRDPADQRCHQLELTRDGRAACHLLKDIRTDLEAHMFAQLDRGERKQLSALLQRCLQGLQAGD